MNVAKAILKIAFLREEVDLSPLVFVKISDDNKRISYEEISRGNLVSTLKQEPRNPGKVSDSGKGRKLRFRGRLRFRPRIYR